MLFIVLAFDMCHDICRFAARFKGSMSEAILTLGGSAVFQILRDLNLHSTSGESSCSSFLFNLICCGILIDCYKGSATMELNVARVFDQMRNH